VDSGEACDDGNETNGDVCQNDCTPPEGGAELCRTPGFWATHACGAYGGFTQCEKANSSNITQTVINDCGGCLDVCGDVITNTGVLNADSALEAMCVSPRGAQILQLVRQLTAAALNCCISASDASCGGVSVEPVFSACNAACAAGQVTAVVGGNTVNCINAVDCFNNGGQFDSSNGACWFGFADNCHQRAEDNFGICDDGTICTDGTCADGSQCKPGPAGSSRACSSATANKCQVVNLAANCTAGGTNGPQSCP
jgi:cysteine-rich repeat protein